MSETITITINGQEIQTQPGQMLIDVADANNITIPRFCYHKKLSVAANCRMCLVEVEKMPKPMPACATPINDGMVVKTRSSSAIAAQKSVLGKKKHKPRKQPSSCVSGYALSSR